MAKTALSTKPPKTVAIVASITLRNGRKIFARNYGLKGFPIKIRSGALRRALKKRRR